MRSGRARSEALCRDLAARKGWAVAEVYADVGDVRAGYLRLVDDVEAGRRDAVIVASADR